jgi:hypothetical protein
MPEEIQQDVNILMDVPEERRHALFLRMSGGLVLKQGVEGHEEYVPCIAIKAGMAPWNKVDDPKKDEQHLFIIDLRQALKLKRTIERTLASLGDRAKDIPEA